MKIGQAVSVSNDRSDIFTGAIVAVYSSHVVIELFPDSEKAFFDIYVTFEPDNKLRFTKRSSGSYILKGFKYIKLHY